MLDAFAQLDSGGLTPRNLRSTSIRNARTVSGSSVAASCRPEPNETMAAEIKRRKLADNRQRPLGSIDLGVPPAITSEAQGATAVEHGIVEKVPFLRVAVCFHRGDHDSK